MENHPVPLWFWILVLSLLFVIALFNLPHSDTEMVTVREATIEERVKALEDLVAVLEETKADMAMVLAGCTCQQINAMGVKK